MTKGRDGIRLQLWTLVAAMVVVVVAVSGAGYIGIVDAANAREQVLAQVVPIRNANVVAGRAMTEIDGSLRGWVLTGNHDHLQTLRRAQRDLRAAAALLSRRSASDPQLAALVTAQDVAVDSWMRGYLEPHLRAIGSGQDYRPVLFELGHRGFAVFRDANDALASYLDDAAAAARGTATEKVRQTLHRSLWTAVTGIVLVILIGAAISRRICSPLVRLRRVVDRLAAGDRDVRAELRGPSEVRRIAASLNSAADFSDTRLDIERQVVDQLRELDRAKNEFIANVSHELRTPLTNISGYLELLNGLLHDRITDSERAMLTTIGRNTGRLSRLIEDLLTLGRAEAEHTLDRVDVIDVATLVEEVAEDVAATARRRNIAVTVDVDGAPAVSDADPDQLSRAILNVVSNAVKFSRADGAVTVTVTGVGEHVCVEVADRGIGIPAEALPHLGTKFFRAANATRDEVPGTGLGLRIVHQIISAHGGTVDISSTVGVGTTVRLLLPGALVPVG